MTVVVDVRDILPAGDLPEHMYEPVIMLALAARRISDSHQICTVCLIEALMVLVQEAVDQGRLTHDNPGDTLQ